MRETISVFQYFSDEGNYFSISAISAMRELFQYFSDEGNYFSEYVSRATCQSKV
jgi:hypothetical protein